MPYNDTYLKSKNKDELQAMCNDFYNRLGPIQGSNESTCLGPTGETITLSARGNPEYWYAIIRSSCQYVFPYDGVEQATKSECEEVCGVWA